MHADREAGGVVVAASASEAEAQYVWAEVAEVLMVRLTELEGEPPSPPLEGVKNAEAEGHTVALAVGSALLGVGKVDTVPPSATVAEVVAVGRATVPLPVALGDGEALEPAEALIAGVSVKEREGDCEEVLLKDGEVDGEGEAD